MTTVDFVQFIVMLAICGAILVDDLVQKKRVKVLIRQLENIRDKIPKAVDPDKFADEVATALNKLIERGLPSEKTRHEKEVEGLQDTEPTANNRAGRGPGGNI